ncbi:MAG: hypothetical protein ACR2QM_07010 [Longimicrobiales bacterium]
MASQLGQASGIARWLIFAQGVVTFLSAGGIWLVYATMIMTGSWEPRLQDFFAPLVILALIFVGIRAIGTNDTVWFLVAGSGWANAFFGQRFALPPEVAERLGPTSSLAWRAHGTNLAMSVTAVLAAIATLAGDPSDLVKLALVSTLAATQFLASSFHYQWWRAA